MPPTNRPAGWSLWKMAGFLASYSLFSGMMYLVVGRHGGDLGTWNYLKAALLTGGIFLIGLSLQRLLHEV